MTLLWADGFDHYGTDTTGRDNMTAAGYTSGDAAVAPSSDYQRTGPNYCAIFENAADRTLSRTIPTTSFTIGVGFGLYLTDYPTGDNNCFFQLKTSGGTAILTVCFTSTGAIAVRSGGNTGSVLGSSAASAYNPTAFDHIEIKSVINSSTGSVSIRVNGNQVLSLTGLNLGSSAAGIAFWSSTSDYGTGTGGIDDLVIWDGEGSVNNDFLGPARVLTYYPEGDTAEADWAPNSGSTGYTQIDDTVPDGDTTYVEADELGDVSEFTFGDMEELENVIGVRLATNAKLAAAGSGSMKSSLVSGGEVSSGPNSSLTTNYVYYSSIHELDPDTSASWTRSSLEAALLRVEKTA
jgi:hypothetical protein